MAKPRGKGKFGPPIGAEVKWSYVPGDVVHVSHGSVMPMCAENGAIVFDGNGKISDALGSNAICAVVARVPNPPIEMFRMVTESGEAVDPEERPKCYLVLTLTEADIQPKDFFRSKIGKFFLVPEDRVGQTAKEKRIMELGLWNHETYTFDSRRIAEFRNRVHEDEMKNKAPTRDENDR